MLTRLVHVTMRRTGSQGERVERLDVAALSIGRGPDNNLCLSDLSVSLRHARVSSRGGEIQLEAIGGSLVQVNGELCTASSLRVGDVIRIGQMELSFEEPEGNEDLALRIRSVSHRGSELEDLLARSDLRLERGLFARRPLSWLSVVACLVAFLVLPLFGRDLPWQGLLGLWSSGAVDRAHAHIGNDCGACHPAGFERTPDTGCLVCHAVIEAHVPPAIDTTGEATVTSSTALASASVLGDFEARRCAACHREHDSTLSLVDHPQALCSDCHESLAAQRPQSELSNVSDFDRQHPEFRFFLPNEEGEVGPFAWSPSLRESPGVVFNHWTHVARGVRDPRGDDQHLRCDECHTPDVSGRLMLPVRFEASCRRCHSLGFDPALPGAEARHGDPVQMRDEMRGRYSQHALRGEVVDEAAPRFLRLRRPGRPFDRAEAKAVSSWVDRQVTQADERLFETPGECARCHLLSGDDASDGGFAIEAVRIPQRWLPRARFDHAAHRGDECRRCHPAAAAFDPEEASPRPEWAEPGRPYALSTPAELAALNVEASREASDILVPNIDVCRECHAGGDGTAPRVASPCVMCHAFHKPGLPALASSQSLARAKLAGFRSEGNESVTKTPQAR